MKRFTEFQKKSKRINEQELTLPKNTEETTKQEQPEPQQVTEQTPVKFFSKLFEARQMAHIFHLQVKAEMGSGWEHDALNDFYDSLKIEDQAENGSAKSIFRRQACEFCFG